VNIEALEMLIEIIGRYRIKGFLAKSVKPTIDSLAHIASSRSMLTCSQIKTVEQTKGNPVTS
jgi:hypothetical protein